MNVMLAVHVVQISFLEAAAEALIQQERSHKSQVSVPVSGPVKYNVQFRNALVNNEVIAQAVSLMKTIFS